MSFNTGNPLPSKDILDLYDNSENIDQFTNSQQDEIPDRFGVKRLTLAGLIKRSMALRNEINDFSGALTFRPEWSDVPMNVSVGVGGEGGALNLQAEALGNRSEINKVTSREALRRSYAEAGYNLVDGSFEAGGTLVNASDVLLYESTGVAYSYSGTLPHTIGDGETPVGNPLWLDKGNQSLRGELANASNAAMGDVLVAVKQPFAGSVARTAHDKNAECVSVTDFAEPGSVGVGNAVSDTAAINAALNSGAKRIEFGSLNYKLNNWLIIPNPDMVLISDNATFEQTLWGYPAFEIRTPRVKMVGNWMFKYTGDRTAVISSNTLGYSYVTSGDWRAYGSAIWMNYYEGRDISGFHIDKLTVFGFIAGIWFTGNRASIGEAYFDTVDFGVFGVVFDNQTIGPIYHKNITASQGHEGHALYTSGTGKGLVCGPVYVEGSPLACAPVKVHQTKNFRVESISGVGLSTIAYFRQGATGSVGSVNCVCDVNANFTGPGQDPTQYNILAVDAGTDVSIGPVTILANQQGVVKPNALQSSGGALLTIKGGFDYINTNSSPQQPSVALCSSGGGVVFEAAINISHPSSLATAYIFNLLSYSKFSVAVPPKVSIGAGGEVLLLKNTYNASNNYELAYDPALIFPGVGPNTIICTANTYFGIMFRGTGKAFNSITGATPIITHTAQANVTQTAATDLARLRYMSPGQRVTIRNTDGNSNIGHNRFAGLDGNIITHTGADILRATWKFATFAKLGGADLNVYLTGIV